MRCSRSSIWNIRVAAPLYNRLAPYQIDGWSVQLFLGTKSDQIDGFNYLQGKGRRKILVGIKALPQLGIEPLLLLVKQVH